MVRLAPNEAALRANRHALRRDKARFHHKKKYNFAVIENKKQLRYNVIGERK